VQLKFFSDKTGYAPAPSRARSARLFDRTIDPIV